MASKPKKALLFAWEGSDRKGKRLKGEMPALSSALVKADLRRQGISPIKVRKKSKALFSSGQRPIKAKDIAIFSRQLATMLSAGIPLVQAFEIISKGSDQQKMAELVLALKTDIESGSSLAEAMHRHPRQFDNLYYSLVKAGEQAGILETLLDRIATYREKTEALKGKIKKAMFYPLSVVVIAFVVTIALLGWVVPQFEELFSSMGGELPFATQMVIALSAIVQESWWMIFGGMGVAGAMIYKLQRDSEPFKLALDKMVLQLPLFGNIVRKATIARFTRTLATMFSAGVPLVEAMESVAGATGNRIYAKAVLDAREHVVSGQQLQTAIQQTQLFPPMVVQMIAIGEESGSLDDMLAKVSDFYEREVDEAVDGLSSLIEPVIMVVLGGLIGGLVIAMYLPVFKMGQMM